MTLALNLDILIGVLLAVGFLYEYFHDSEINREIREETGIDLIPGGEALLIAVVLGFSPLWPVVAAWGLLREVFSKESDNA